MVLFSVVKLYHDMICFSTPFRGCTWITIFKKMSDWETFINQHGKCPHCF